LEYRSTIIELDSMSSLSAAIHAKRVKISLMLGFCDLGGGHSLTFIAESGTNYNVCSRHLYPLV
jgi:hypothetical protein